MRKKKKIILRTMCFCLLFAATKVYASEIIFDADAVREKAAAKSSLMDVNGIYVFSDEFIEQELIVKQAQSDKLEEMVTLVLTNPQQKLDCDSWVNLVLQADVDKYIGDVYNEKEEKNLRWWIYCGTASICILCIIIMIDDKRKKEKYQIREETNADRTRV